MFIISVNLWIYVFGQNDWQTQHLLRWINGHLGHTFSIDQPLNWVLPLIFAIIIIV